MTKARKPWVAGVLTLLGKGLGHVYTGRPKRGLALFGIDLLLSAVFMAFFAMRTLNVFSISAGILVGLAYTIYCICDAVKIARERGANYELAKYNKWFVYLGYYIVLSLCVNGTVTGVVSGVVKSNFLRAYKIPSSSMEPTILRGDQILVDRRPSARQPKRGDIVVFEYPEDATKDFVKRVVAVGGDTVQVRDKQLYVNGRTENEPYTVHEETDLIPAAQNPRDNFGPQVVPEGSYFMMGDNRDRAYDSRFWGTVSKEKIRGTVKSIYWSWDHEKSAVRWSRIGMNLL